MPKLKIMLVEDNPGDVRIIREILMSLPYVEQLQVMKDGEEAVDYLSGLMQDPEKPLPELILLDINIPKKNGIEVLKIIKETPGLKSIPVVMLTSSENMNDILTCYRLHANSFITKPINFEDFEEMFETLLKYWSGIAKLPY